MSQKEQFDPVEFSRESAERAKVAHFHGSPDAEYALGFSNLSNFYGERVLLRGNISDRWTIAERMGSQGAEVITSSVYDEGNPQKRPKQGSKLYSGGKFDRVAVANVGGFLSTEGRVKEFKYLLGRTKLQEGGSLGVTAFDFENFENHAAQSENQAVRLLGALTKDFAETTGLDRLAGRTLQDEVVAAVGKNKKLQVEVTINQRPTGTEDWPELLDLLAFQEGIIGKALKSLPPDFIAKSIARNAKAPNGKNLIEFKRDLNALKARILALRPSVEEILALPSEERPETEPPLIYRAVVSQK